MLPPIIHTRTDLHVEVTPVPVGELGRQRPAESSAAIRKRVIAARAIQTARFRDANGIHCNAQMTSKQTHQYCVLDDSCRRIIELAMERLGLSARAYDRILKVARTIADLDGSEAITTTHLSEAINYRSLDRENWGR